MRHCTRVANSGSRRCCTPTAFENGASKRTVLILAAFSLLVFLLSGHPGQACPLATGGGPQEKENATSGQQESKKPTSAPPSNPKTGSQGGSPTYRFQLQNNSGYSISHVYLNPVGSSYWASDRLGTQILKPGYQFTFTNIRPGTYDLKMVDADGHACIIQDVKISGNLTYTLTPQTLLDCETK